MVAKACFISCASVPGCRLVYIGICGEEYDTSLVKWAAATYRPAPSSSLVLKNVEDPEQLFTT